MRQLRNNLSFHVIDLNQLMLTKPSLIKKLLQELSIYFEQNTFHPLPHRSFSIANAKKAFRTMSQGKHIGKIVLSLQYKQIKIRPKITSTSTFSNQKTYLITGGLGGLGLVLAQWLANRGARYLVLASRHGITSTAQQKIVTQLQNAGVAILTPKVDITNKTEINTLLTSVNKTCPPLAGIFHLASIFADAPLIKLNPEQLQCVLNPKVSGTWYLHQASLNYKLDYFVLFSSTSSQFGTPGQANYAAANAYLDGFVHYRRTLGLPAITINWGHILETGYAARHSSVKELLIKAGDEGITPSQITTALGYFLQHKNLHISFMNMNWQTFNRKHTVHRPLQSLSNLVNSTASTQSGLKNNDHLQELLFKQPIATQKITLQNYLREQISHVLELPINTISLEKKLNEMGLDSLMAIELKNKVENDLTITLPITQMIEGPTITQLVTILLQQLYSTTNDNHSEIRSTHKQESEYIVTLKSGNLSPSLFCIHPVDGRVSIYEPMIKIINAQFPIYGIISPSLVDNKIKQYSSLHELSHDYAQIIINHQPKGPYALFGFSVGGVIALNIAKRLEEQGKKITFLGLADPILPVTTQNNKAQLLEIYLQLLFNSLREFLHNINPNFQNIINDLSKKIVTTQSKEKQQQFIIEHLFNEQFIMQENDMEKIHRYIELSQIHIELLLTDKFEIIEAPIITWRPTHSIVSNKIQTALLAKRCRTKPKTIIIDGDHFSMMKSPHIQTLLESFESYIQAQVLELL